MQWAGAGHHVPNIFNWWHVHVQEGEVDDAALLRCSIADARPWVCKCWCAIRRCYMDEGRVKGGVAGACSIRIGEHWGGTLRRQDGALASWFRDFPQRLMCARSMGRNRLLLLGHDGHCDIGVGAGTGGRMPVLNPIHSGVGIYSTRLLLKYCYLNRQRKYADCKVSWRRGGEGWQASGVGWTEKFKATAWMKASLFVSPWISSSPVS